MPHWAQDHAGVGYGEQDDDDAHHHAIKDHELDFVVGDSPVESFAELCHTE